jgi:RNA polymerase sigma-70 factor (ECF subfamily)
MQNHDLNVCRLDDEALVEQAQSGDKQAFAALIERHYAACTKVAFSVLRDREDAEDEVQNACWKAYEHLGQFQRDAKFSTWLTRIVVNQCLMRLRQVRRARLTYIEDVSAEGGRVYELQAGDLSPEQELARTEVAGVLEDEIKRIPPLLRHVFVLRELQQLPMPQVAEELGISVAAAKSRLLRARQELRTRLARHQGRLGPATLFAS